jgi:gamma-glutamylcyclotransferase (GGCT)/AIG2-like uncharacterized protein YtfP
MNLFAYGSLMCQDIMAAVSGFCAAGVPGTARGYRRRSVKGETYPAMVADASCDTGGVVYRDLPDAAWERLDRFEGDLYARLDVAVELEDGGTVPAEAYIVRPEHVDCLEASGWDFDVFLREGKARFLREYKGFRA